jgi:hypothetical protein
VKHSKTPQMEIDRAKKYLAGYKDIAEYIFNMNRYISIKCIDVYNTLRPYGFRIVYCNSRFLLGGAVLEKGF